MTGHPSGPGSRFDARAIPGRLVVIHDMPHQTIISEMEQPAAEAFRDMVVRAVVEAFAIR